MLLLYVIQKQMYGVWIHISQMRKVKVKFSLEFFWVVRRTVLLHSSGPSENGSNVVLRNFGILQKHYTASKPRRTRLETLPL
jgi:hypothetical protein